MLYVTDDTIKEFNNCEIKIKDVELIRNPLRAGYVLSIYAWAVPKVQWFEEETAYGFITSGSDMSKPVGYRLEIPYEMWYKSQCEGPNEIIDYIERSMPPLFEEHICEILDKVVEMIYEENRYVKNKR